MISYFKICFVLVLGLFVLTSVSHADLPEQVIVLEDTLHTLATTRDSLVKRQQVLQKKSDSLAVVIEGLKRQHAGGVASGALAQALRQSLLFTIQLEEVYEQELGVRRHISLRHKMLRDVVGVELDRLVGELGGKPDTQHVRTLRALQTVWQRVANESDPNPVPVLTIEADDTPGDLRIKKELMSDVSQQLIAENREIDQQIKRLEEERRLRARLNTFANEFGLFDETLSQGRALTAQTRQEIVTEPSAPSEEPNFGLAGIAGPPDGGAASDGTLSREEGDLTTAPNIGREILLDGMPVPGEKSGDALSQELQKLMGRKAAIAKQQALVLERIARFEHYLKQLLEGDTP